MFSYSAVQWIGRLCLLLPAHQIGTWYWQPSGSISTFSQFIFFAILRLYQNCSNNESRKDSKEEVGRKITLNGSSRFRERGIREYKLRVNLSGVSGERFESPPPRLGNPDRHRGMTTGSPGHPRMRYHPGASRTEVQKYTIPLSVFVIVYDFYWERFLCKMRRWRSDDG